MEQLVRAGATGPTDVSRSLGISAAVTTLVVDRLPAAGHLTRALHPSDRRKGVLTPAPASAAAAQSYVDRLLRAITDLTDALNPATRPWSQTSSTDSPPPTTRPSPDITDTPAH